MKLRLAALALLATLPVTPANAEVRRADQRSFAVGGTIDDLAVTPSALWSALIRPARWWDKTHTWSGDAANLRMTPGAGGCFCEKLARGGSVEHLRVVRFEPDRMLVMDGALGPLQGSGATGSLTIVLTAHGGGTGMAWSYSVDGVRDGPAIAPQVDRVLGAQFQRLAALFPRR